MRALDPDIFPRRLHVADPRSGDVEGTPAPQARRPEDVGHLEALLGVGAIFTGLIEKVAWALHNTSDHGADGAAMAMHLEKRAVCNCLWKACIAFDGMLDAMPSESAMLDALQDIWYVTDGVSEPHARLVEVNRILAGLFYKTLKADERT